MNTAVRTSSYRSAASRSALNLDTARRSDPLSLLIETPGRQFAVGDGVGQYVAAPPPSETAGTVEHGPDHADAALGKPLGLQLAEVPLDLVRPEGCDALAADRFANVVFPPALVAASGLGREIFPPVFPPRRDGVIDRGRRSPCDRLLGHRGGSRLLFSDQTGEFSFGLAPCAMEGRLTMPDSSGRVPAYIDRSSHTFGR